MSKSVWKALVATAACAYAFSACAGTRFSHRPGVEGAYDVWVRWNFTGGNEDARIEIAHAGGVTGYSFDQRRSPGWHFAGSYVLRRDSEILATNRGAYGQPHLAPPRGFDEVRVTPTVPRTVVRKAGELVSVCELNHGDTLEFTLVDGRVRRIALVGTSARVLERHGDDVRKYAFAVELAIDGKTHTLERTVPSVEFLNGEPFTIDGVDIWPDAVQDLFRENGGFFLEKDFRYVAAACRPMRRARIVLQDATRRIVPERMRMWCPVKAWPLDPRDCYNGRDCWMGPWYQCVGSPRGAEAHCGVDVNMPAHTPLTVPFDLDDQHYFHAVKAGDNNNRWRGVRHWNANEWWWIQAHHIDTPYLVPEHTPLAAGCVYALSGGEWSGDFPHTHFNVRVFTRRPGPDGCDEIESYWINPAVLFRQMRLDNPSSDPEVPFCALRFGHQATDEAVWPELYAALAKNRQAFDEMWFSTGIAFPSSAWHEAQSARCARAAEDLRKIGIVPSVELQTTVGHVDTWLGHLDHSAATWSHWTGWDGTVCGYIACPRDPQFVDYVVRMAEIYAAWKPGSMWFDDDVRTVNRAHTKNVANDSFGHGCWCDRCLREFSSREGKAWTRETLVAAAEKDEALRSRYYEHCVDALSNFVFKAASAAHRISPETRFGYQFGWFSAKIPAALHQAGGAPVRLRPGGGAYWDTDPHAQLGKAYYLDAISSEIRKEPWIEAACPEIESCPRTFFCRTPQGIVLEAFENLALGMDFLSMFVGSMAPHCHEEMWFWSDRLFPRLATAHGFLKDYRDLNRGTKPVGFKVDFVYAKLLGSRGLPIAPMSGVSLGALPSVDDIPVRTTGSVDSRDVTHVMEIMSGKAWREWAAKADAVSGQKLPIVFPEPVRLFAMPRCLPDGMLRSVALINCSNDRQDPLVVVLRGVPENASSAIWRPSEGDPVSLPVVCKDGVTSVTLPRIGAWECGYLAL